MRKNTLKSLQIRNLLSFGSDSPGVELGDLNVLIGPNGSGKSNLIEIIGLLRSAPRDLAAEVGDSGGVAEWLWKDKTGGKIPTASIQVDACPLGVNKTISYRLSFTRVGPQLKIVDERIENHKADEGQDKPCLYFDLNGGRPMLNVGGQPRLSSRKRLIPNVRYSRSVRIRISIPK